ncbi:NAD(P)-binding domain-containing protein [Mesorhizobium sp. dw_380]|uniref:NAD(P)-binding domain-containing protein n=1 Tax=Mesorhizobium sp. dw_380 TaxID=2812001 RepID=UPI001BDF5803|nr:NAD(P)-binding domain-containing protein [Mesorhizobium sp. dw_380]
MSYSIIGFGAVGQALARMFARQEMAVSVASTRAPKAFAAVASLVEQLGYAPVSLGRIAEGGQLVQARDKSWAPLIFQDLFKKRK